MQRRHFTLSALGLALGGSALAQSGSFPSKPIRMIVPFPPGGGTDILARLIATRLSEQLRWNIVADNKAGAGGTLGITEAVRATPTGHDLVMGQKDNLVIAPWLYRNLPWDPTRDLVPVAHVAYTPVVIATAAGSRLRSIADVVQASKAAPGSIRYGSPGNGTSIHLAAELFEKAAGITLSHIPYKGSSPAMADALAGHVELLSSSVPSAIAQIRAGRLRALAVTSARRSSSLPEVPTLAESGHKDFDVSTWYGLLAPAGTPEAVVTQINTEVNRLLANAEVRAAIHAQGAEPESMTPARFGALIRSDYTRWKAIVEASGAKID